MVDQRLSLSEFEKLTSDDQWFYLLTLKKAEEIAGQYAHMAGTPHTSTLAQLGQTSMMDIKYKTGDYPRYFNLFLQSLVESVAYIDSQPDEAWSVYLDEARMVARVYNSNKIYH